MDVPIRKFLIFVATVQSVSSNPIYGQFPTNMETSPLLGALDPIQENYQTSQEFEEISYFQHSTPEYNFNNETATSDPETHAIDSWSIMWYLISFGGLITFFLLVSFSEVCCKKSIPVLTEVNEQPEVSSPPPYDLFAPPTYDSLFDKKESEKSKKGKSKHKETNVFFIVVPDDKLNNAEPIRENPVEFGEVISRNSMGDGEVVTPPPPP